MSVELSKEFIQQAQEIYDRKLKHLEKTNFGGVVALDIDTEEWVVGENTLKTWKRFTEEFGRNRKHIMLFVLNVGCGGIHP